MQHKNAFLFPLFLFHGHAFLDLEALVLEELGGHSKGKPRLVLRNHLKLVGVS
jgi:hypothetical protein